MYDSNMNRTHPVSKSEYLRARSEEQINDRQTEIMNACRTLFDRTGYDGVSIKAISEITSISRPSIYTYYKTKDEILLDILSGDLHSWITDVGKMIRDKSPSSKEEFCSLFVDILMNYSRMIQLSELLFNIIEKNASLEKIIVFKKTFALGLQSLAKSFSTVFPEFTNEKLLQLIQQIIALVLGSYSMCNLTDKEKEAIKLSGTGYVIPDYRKMCCDGILSALLFYL